jgi:hypothetical protein
MKLSKKMEARIKDPFNNGEFWDGYKLTTKDLLVDVKSLEKENKKLKNKIKIKTICNQCQYTENCPYKENKQCYFTKNEKLGDVSKISVPTVMVFPDTEVMNKIVRKHIGPNWNLKSNLTNLKDLVIKYKNIVRNKK